MDFGNNIYYIIIIKKGVIRPNVWRPYKWINETKKWGRNRIVKEFDLNKYKSMLKAAALRRISPEYKSYLLCKYGYGKDLLTNVACACYGSQNQVSECTTFRIIDPAIGIFRACKGSNISRSFESFSVTTVHININI